MSRMSRRNRGPRPSRISVAGSGAVPAPGSTSGSAVPSGTKLIMTRVSRAWAILFNASRVGLPRPFSRFAT